MLKYIDEIDKLGMFLLLRVNGDHEKYEDIVVYLSIVQRLLHECCQCKIGYEIASNC